MRSTLDFSPLFRSSIGFDRMLNSLASVGGAETFNNWPPYDITKADEDNYRITMAVAGFSLEDLTIIQEQNMLLVSGQRSDDGATEYLHRGIDGRAFEHRFELADYVRVENASLANGLLTIDLKREIPEEKKPRRIEIATDNVMPKIEAKTGTAAKQAA